MMKKFIGGLAIAIAAALLGILGFNMLRNSGPRERVKTEGGGKAIVEELSYYSGGRKVFGKVYKPTDEEGNFTKEFGSLPTVVFLHKPLATSLPEKTLKNLTSHGLVGYQSAFHGKQKDVRTVMKKLASESFVEKDLMFLVADSTTAEVAAEYAARHSKDIAGLVLVAPSEEVASSPELKKVGKDVLVVKDAAGAMPSILGYLEEKGAMK